MPNATFCCPDLDTFCLLDRLGLSATGQQVHDDHAVLECRVLEPDDWCHDCGCQGTPRDSAHLAVAVRLETEFGLPRARGWTRSAAKAFAALAQSALVAGVDQLYGPFWTRPSEQRSTKPAAAERRGEGRIHGGVDVEGSSRAELVERATKAGVKGYSSMNRSELGDAPAQGVVAGGSPVRCQLRRR